MKIVKDEKPVHEITEMWAFCAVNEGGEGLMGMQTAEGWLPLVGTDMARIASLFPVAKDAQRKTGKRILLKKFSLISAEEI